MATQICPESGGVAPTSARREDAVVEAAAVREAERRERRQPPS
jgi:hypothetical protein